MQEGKGTTHVMPVIPKMIAHSLLLEIGGKVCVMNGCVGMRKLNKNILLNKQKKMQKMSSGKTSAACVRGKMMGSAEQGYNVKKKNVRYGTSTQHGGSGLNTGDVVEMPDGSTLTIGEKQRPFKRFFTALWDLVICMILVTAGLVCLINIILMFHD